MNRRRRPLLLFLLAALPFSGSTRAAGTVEAELVSKYVDRGLVVSDLTLHASAEAAAGNAYGGLWTATPLEGRDPPEDYADELELYAGYGWALDSRTALDAGATFYHYPGSDDSFEGYVGVYRRIGSFSPAFYLYRDFDLETTTLEATFAATSPLPKWPISLEAQLGRVLADHGPDYTYYGLGTEYRLEIDRNSQLALGLAFAGHDLQDYGERQSLVASAAWRFEF